jgi:hypothetical protein
LIAAEGCFLKRSMSPYGDGSPRWRFSLQVTMAQRDLPLLEALRSFLGAGSVYGDARPKRPGWLPISTFAVSGHRRHMELTIPFIETFMPSCAKRAQFEAWRRDLSDQESAHPLKRGRGICREPGCSDPIRGRGLCRRHYYRATGY